MVQAWLRIDSGLVQTRFRFLVYASFRLGSGLDQAWLRLGPGLVQARFRLGSGFGQVWLRGLIQVLGSGLFQA